MTDRVSVAAHAKFNPFLRVLSRDTSGYHGIETAFALLELADRITVERRPSGITIEVNGPDLGPDADNLAVRAADALLNSIGRPFGVHLHLEKHVPAQAGLGGGSSDAAATLHAVNQLAGTPVPRHELLQLAARLGADVPFFASGAPFAVAWHHGTRLFRLPAPSAAPVLLAVPPTGVPTADAYAWIDAHPAPTRGAVVLDLDALTAWGPIGRLGGNDFEPVVFGRHPSHRQLFERLAETGPLLVRLSGSGSAFVAVYRSEPERDGAATVIGTSTATLIPTETRAHAAPAPRSED